MNWWTVERTMKREYEVTVTNVYYVPAESLMAALATVQVEGVLIARTTDGRELPEPKEMKLVRTIHEFIPMIPEFMRLVKEQQ